MTNLFRKDRNYFFIADDCFKNNGNFSLKQLLLISHNRRRSDVFHDFLTVFPISPSAPRKQILSCRFGHLVAKISHSVSFLPGLVSKTISAFLPGVLLPHNFLSKTDDKQKRNQDDPPVEPLLIILRQPVCTGERACQRYPWRRYRRRFGAANTLCYDNRIERTAAGRGSQRFGGTFSRGQAARGTLRRPGVLFGVRTGDVS
jgi:hypothetical protein